VRARHPYFGDDPTPRFGDDPTKNHSGQLNRREQIQLQEDKMPTTIRIVREFAYEVEGIINLPDWYDPKIHTHKTDGERAFIFNQSKQSIWEGELEWDRVDDVEHDFVKEKIYNK
jgi:hypothetical protein